MNRRSVRVGGTAAAGLVVFYVAVVGGFSGSLGHLVDQARRDWYYLAPIIGGFGLQVALLAELRRRRALHGRAAVAGGAGSGSSTVGMVACCAHHIADLVPFVGATGVAALLLDYRVPFMLLGIGVNAVGVTVAARRLAGLHQPSEARECAVV
ncbi:MAG: hypothetical protein HYU28_09100 [Actinobacteria bacterium]|nr:hypothetical protein [Actinomycetota bacterium]